MAEFLDGILVPEYIFEIMSHSHCNIHFLYQYEVFTKRLLLCSVDSECKWCRADILFADNLDPELCILDKDETSEQKPIPPPRKDSYMEQKPIPPPRKDSCMQRHLVDKISTYVEEPEEEHQYWDRQFKYLLACVAFVSGLGTVLKFPGLAVRHGGGAFFVAYMAMMLLCGCPMVYLETTLGQYSTGGPITAWKVVLLFRGLGTCMLVVSIFLSLYYVMEVVWAVVYLSLSIYGCIQGKMPWINYTTSGKILLIFICNDIQIYLKSHSYLMSHRYLMIVIDIYTEILHLSQGLEHIGLPQWYLVLSLLLVWVVIFCCLFRGAKSLGKVVCVTAVLPYLILPVLFVFSCLSPGSLDGIKYFLNPQWRMLGNLQIWVDAATLMVYSLGLGTGCLSTLASYTHFHSHCFRNLLLICFANMLGLMVSGFSMYAVLGVYANITLTSVQSLKFTEYELGFAIFPYIISKISPFPGFSVLFFMVLILLGIDGELVLVQNIVAGIVDMLKDRGIKVTKRRRIIGLLAVCITLFAVGMVLTTEGGLYVTEFLNSYACGVSVLVILLLECLVLMYLYGATKFTNNIADMTGNHDSPWWKWSWRFITPIILLCLIIISSLSTRRLSYREYIYPDWTEALGWILTVLPLTLIPIEMLFAIQDETGPYIMKQQEVAEMAGGYISDIMTVSSTDSEDEDEENGDRGNWQRKVEFILSCLGYVLGLGNIWRFPFLVYRNGGGAFFVAYIVMLLFCGIPLVYMEMAFGQFGSLGPINIWKAVPLFKGVGYCMVISTAMVSYYYNMINSWALHFLFSSFYAILPWTTCGNQWNTDRCQENKYHSSDCTRINTTYIHHPDFVNHSCYEVLEGCTNPNSSTQMYELTNMFGEDSYIKGTLPTLRSPSEEYFYLYVLKRSESITDLGPVDWQLALYFLLSWGIVFICLVRGIYSAGKVAYVVVIVPFVILIILLIFAMMVDGHLEGIKFFVTPDWNRLWSPGMWSDAASQAFFSLSVMSGGLTTLASYNKFHNNICRDAILICLIDTLMSTLAGFTVFATIGILAHELNTKVENVIESATGLVFIVLPAAIQRFNPPQLWSGLFFIMILLMGLSSQMMMVEMVVTAIIDEKVQILRKWRILVLLCVCSIFYLLGLPQATQAGIYILQLVDEYAATIPLLVNGICMCLALAWIYRIRHFSSDLQHMTGFPVSSWWKVMWSFVTPIIIIILLVLRAVGFKSLSSVEPEHFPHWIDVLGIFLCLLPLSPIPVCAIIKIIQYDGTFPQRVKKACESEPSWGPAHVKHWKNVEYYPAVNTHTLAVDIEHSPLHTVTGTCKYASQVHGSFEVQVTHLISSASLPVTGSDITNQPDITVVPDYFWNLSVSLSDVYHISVFMPSSRKYSSRVLLIV
ncbi:hypothetical protein ACJMK2_030648 [Sinanodonta woodiana]|uniref:Transporter n=1 Tax=Sinanodonta woodiana TaxID=1069815 RepID=A0ABD3WYF2_SINWO